MMKFVLKVRIGLVMPSADKCCGGVVDWPDNRFDPHSNDVGTVYLLFWHWIELARASAEPAGLFSSWRRFART